MDFTQEKLEEIIRDCCFALLEQQPMLFTKENDINEETVSTEMLTLMKPFFANYHVNCEYNRMTNEYGEQQTKKVIKKPGNEKKNKVKPDIIVHRQEDGKHNLLAIEVKMQWKNSRKNEDFIKLESYKRNLNYTYALYLEMGEGGITDMIWF